MTGRRGGGEREGGADISQQSASDNIGPHRGFIVSLMVQRERERETELGKVAIWGNTSGKFIIFDWMGRDGVRTNIVSKFTCLSYCVLKPSLKCLPRVAKKFFFVKYF